MSDPAKPPAATPDDAALEEPRQVDELGVDLTLVRETLRMSPTERLVSLQNAMNTLASVRVVRRAGEERVASTEPDPVSDR
jgi:hypothetical protein